MASHDGAGGAEPRDGVACAIEARAGSVSLAHVSSKEQLAVVLARRVGVAAPKRDARSGMECNWAGSWAAAPSSHRKAPAPMLPPRPGQTSLRVESRSLTQKAASRVSSRRAAAPMDHSCLIFHQTLVAGDTGRRRYKWVHCGAGDITAEAVWGICCRGAFDIT